MRGLVVVSVLTLLLPTRPLAAASHPLDPLSWQEYWTVLEVLDETGKLDGNTRFSMVNLEEPAKESVLGWSVGDPILRHAYAVVRQGTASFEARVDLGARRLTTWTRLEGVQPNYLAEEIFAGMAEAVKKDPAFLGALKRRGVSDPTLLDCVAIPPGFFDTDELKKGRIGHVSCSDPRGVRNSWPRELPGLTAVVDLDAKKVLRVVDEGGGPLPEIKAEYDRTALGPPRQVPAPMRIDQPLGVGYRIDGQVVEWQKWRFHFRADQRVGAVVSTVTYGHGESERQVLYQGSLSEIFVPYMSPSFAWFHRNFLDAGEFSFGGLLKPLKPGLDCPAHAVYFDALVADDFGRPETVPRTLCLFEREAGDPSWRHWEPFGTESRVRRDLVLRSAAVLGNYDYLFDWVFQQNGSIEVAVGATGIAETEAFEQADAREATAGEPADAYGRFVQPHVVAINHDHYFNFRLDLDVDGQKNSLEVDRLVQRKLPPESPRRSLWVVEPRLAKREAEGQLTIDLKKPAIWRVLSTSRTNRVGYPTSYQVMPDKTAITLLSEDDYPRRRAGFIDHHLWVTPYQAEERYAAGDFPTLSRPGQGLPAWTRSNRPVEATDIVVWYTVAMHHVVRAEDWPVMPVLWHRFELRPFDFFDENPALDLP